MEHQPRIDVWFDFICPWCLIGHRQLQHALQAWPGPTPEVHWHGVRLIPDVPAGGLPYDEFYVRRLGSPEAVRARRAQVQAAAAAAGTQIAFDRIRRFPDSAAAHRMHRLARERLDAAACDGLLQRLFNAYFQLGQDIGDTATLQTIGLEAGLPADALTACLAASEAPPPANVPGVPYFLFQREHALSGARSAVELLGHMQRVWGPRMNATTPT